MNWKGENMEPVKITKCPARPARGHVETVSIERGIRIAKIVMDVSVKMEGKDITKTIHKMAQKIIDGMIVDNTRRFKYQRDSDSFFNIMGKIASRHSHGCADISRGQYRLLRSIRFTQPYAERTYHNEPSQADIRIRNPLLTDIHDIF